MYCDPSDLYSYGLPRGALTNAGRLVGSVSTTDDTVELDVHGFAAGQPLRFRPDGDSELPSPLVEGAEYYAIVASESHFQVAATAAGAALDLTTAGGYFVVIASLPVDAAITWASRIIDDMLPAHVVPLTAPYPPIIVMTTAELAAGKLLGGSGGESSSIGAMVDAANERVRRWAKGVPVRGTNAPKAANLSRSATAPHRDSRGWSEFGGL